MKTDQSCGQCDYWDRISESDAGQCRRFPPQVLVTLNIIEEPRLDNETGLVFSRPRIANNVKFMFPQMAEENRGCGEFLKENRNAN